MQFSELLPDLILDCVSSQGFSPTGVLYPLNSYENRVYEIQVEDHPPLIAKFYRPGRWSLEGIGEEHRFVNQLKEFEMAVVAPLELTKHLPDLPTLQSTDGIFYAFYPKFGGRSRDELSDQDRTVLGGLLGRLHNVGESFEVRHRLTISPQTYGHDPKKFILNQEFLPEDLKQSIETILGQALALIEPLFGDTKNYLVIHGDCHMGNILWNRDEPTLVDFDDMMRGPAVQDLWMLFNGTAEEKYSQQEAFLRGYEVFRKFDRKTFVLTEGLRTLRIIRHAAWIGERYGEEAFKRAFPYYEDRRFWEGFLQSLREQISLLNESTWRV